MVWISQPGAYVRRDCTLWTRRIALCECVVDMFTFHPVPNHICTMVPYTTVSSMSSELLCRPRLSPFVIATQHYLYTLARSVCPPTPTLFSVTFLLRAHRSPCPVWKYYGHLIMKMFRNKDVILHGQKWSVIGALLFDMSCG